MAQPRRLQSRIRAFPGAIGLTLALSVVGVQSPMAPDQAWGERPAASDGEGPDRLILTSGQVVHGWIQEEDGISVTILLVSAGIKAPRTYRMTEIHEITRGEGDEPEAGATPQEPRRADLNVPAPRAQPERQRTDDGGTKLYIAELKGRWGVDVSETPLAELFKDVDKTFNDLLPGSGRESGEMVVDPLVRDKHIVVLKLDLVAPSGFSSVFRAEELAPIVMNEINRKGRRVVFWVKKAAGGAAFLPWVSSEIYFLSDGRMGGMADLDAFSTGDEAVDEKLIGAFQGSAEGFVIQGGYQNHLDVMRAMLRKQNWLFVRFEGGKPVYATTRPENPNGWTLLSDDGEGDNEDPEHLIGNDVLSLDAKIAMELGISDGTADSIDDIAFNLGVHRHFTELEGHKGQRVLDLWNERLEDAIRMVNTDPNNGLRRGRLWDDFDDVDVQGDFRERSRLRGQKINILKKIMGLFRRYQEVLDPLEQWQELVQFNIDQLQLEQRVDNAAERSNNGR